MTTTYKVEGMSCGGCVRSLKAALEAAVPEVEIEVELAGGLVHVEGGHDAKAVARAVEDAGYDFVGLLQP